MTDGGGMIERVARAISPHLFERRDDWNDLAPIERRGIMEMRERARERARAAIEAMRLAGNGCPLEDAGINKLDEVMPVENDVQRVHFVAAFNAVITAALKEQE